MLYMEKHQVVSKIIFNITERDASFTYEPKKSNIRVDTLYGEPINLEEFTNRVFSGLNFKITAKPLPGDPIKKLILGNRPEYLSVVVGDTNFKIIYVGGWSQYIIKWGDETLTAPAKCHDELSDDEIVDDYFTRH